MYNRFEIPKETFLENKDLILKRINYFKKNGYKQVFHLIIPGLTEDEIIKFELEELNEVRLYNKYITVDEKTIEIDKYSYIQKIQDLPNTDVINRYYLQCIEGYSSLYPTSNLIIKVDSKLDMYLQEKKIGNLMGDIKTPEIKNIYLGCKKCKTCLNCMCDITKTKGTIFIIDPEECKYKTLLKENVSKEVVEVTKEQYVNLMESMAELLRETTISNDLVIEVLQGGLNG